MRYNFQIPTDDTVIPEQLPRTTKPARPVSETFVIYCSHLQLNFLFLFHFYFCFILVMGGGFVLSSDIFRPLP